MNFAFLAQVKMGGEKFLLDPSCHFFQEFGDKFPLFFYQLFGLDVDGAHGLSQMKLINFNRKKLK